MANVCTASRIARGQAVMQRLAAASLSAISILTFSCALHAQGQQAEPEKPLYLTIDTPPAPELPPAAALETFAIAPGFTIELVVSEPMVRDPVAITWDELGNLYVVQMSGFMQDVYGNNEDAPIGAIVRLRDKDNNGTYESREVLIDKLVLPRAVAIVNEGMLVAEPPNLWLCPNSNGSAATIDCANKIRLGDYGNQPGSVEHAENGLLTGLDNWIYNAKSDRRMQIQNGQLVEQATLFRGQWGITKDNGGRLYYNTNSNLLLGDSYDAQQVIASGNKAAPGLNEQISQNDQLHAIRVNTGVNRAYVPGVLRPDGRLNRPTSASGMTVYRGDQFGEAYREHVFVAEPAANALVQLRLQRDGLKVSAEHVLYEDAQWQQREFLASTDERFRPVDATVGPDGALYIVDMYRGVIQDHVFLTEQLREQALARGLDKPLGRGRIWRIRAQDNALRPLQPSLSSVDEQLAGLSSASGWHRDTAQRLLIAADNRSINKKLQQLARDGDALAAVHALWTLKGRHALTRKIVRRSLNHADSRVRLAALEAGASELKAKDLTNLDTQSNAPLAQQQLFSLAAHDNSADVQKHLIETLTSSTDNAYSVAAVIAASHNQELAFAKSLLASGQFSEIDEQQTQVLKRLTSQAVRNTPNQSEAWLDLAARSAEIDSEQWLTVTILEGLFEISRDSNFERIRLAQAHGIFQDAAQRLWPAISRARRALTWPGDDLAADAKPLTPDQEISRQLGAQYFTSYCAVCHGAGGEGIASLGPPLPDSPWVTGPTEVLARITFNGLAGPIDVNGAQWDGVMPGHIAIPQYTDEVAAGLMTYLHRAWGHSGRAVDAPFMGNIRRQSASRQQPWSTADLADMPVNTHYEKYIGRYGAPQFALEFVFNGKELEVRSAIFNGPMSELREDHFYFEPRDLQVEFIMDDDGQVKAIRMPTADGARMLPRLEG